MRAWEVTMYNLNAALEVRVMSLVYVKLYFLCIINTCGGIETSEHFFFECNNYDAIRTSLFNAISVFGNIDLEMLLFGKGNLLYRDNEKIFLEVQKFIKLSSRFPVR